MYESYATLGSIPPLCHQLLPPGCVVRQQISAVLRGARIVEQVGLCKGLPVFTCTMVVERFIAGRHAARKKHLRLAPFTWGRHT